MKTTQELINDLHDFSNKLNSPGTPVDTKKLIDVMEESAERLFQLDERIAIMREGE